MKRRSGKANSRVPGRGITRRDFLNGVLLGAGAALLDLPAPGSLFAEDRAVSGAAGPVGDYAASAGDPDPVVEAAHGLRDGRYEAIEEIADTAEVYDLAIIGAGLSGLGAAHSFLQTAGRSKRCLLIENHPVFGGHAKRNEFIVQAERLIGPQASNSFVVIDTPGSIGSELFDDLGIPRSFRYSRQADSMEGVYFDRTNYGHMLWYDGAPGYGYHFKHTGWVKDFWNNDMAKAPLSEAVKKDFAAWRSGRKLPYRGDDFEQWLDRMTYQQYLEGVLGLGPEVTRFVDPVLASVTGLGADAVSAFAAYQVAMPGFQSFPRGFSRRAVFEENKWHSFPGGNDGFARLFVKRLIPDAIDGSSFRDVMNRPLNFVALDQPGSRVRIRLNSLCVSVRHAGEPDRSQGLEVVYWKDGRLFRVSARTGVMACGAVSTRRIVRGMPDELQKAYASFVHAPIMLANVALTNWRFLRKLGLSACRWFEGFGFSCNIRRPMVVGDYEPPLDPEKPALLTFYLPFFFPGQSAAEQGRRGRTEMLATSFADYEQRLISQMSALFGSAGFDPKKDVAGIILNRWGHAFVVPGPGFAFGSSAGPSPRSVIRRPFGRISFSHAELNGHQHWLGAVEEGRRAVKQAMQFL